MMRVVFRFSQDQALQLLAIAAFVGVGVMTMFSVGPAAEASAFPVIRWSLTNVAEVADRLRFDVTGEKLRGCQLLSASFAWRLGGKALLPSGVSDDSGRPVLSESFIPLGLPFSIGPFYAVVPPAARLAPEPALIVTYYYRCHWLWVTEQDLVTPVTLAPLPPPAAAPAGPA